MQVGQCQKGRHTSSRRLAVCKVKRANERPCPPHGPLAQSRERAAAPATPEVMPLEPAPALAAFRLLANKLLQDLATGGTCVGETTQRGSALDKSSVISRIQQPPGG